MTVVGQSKLKKFWYGWTFFPTSAYPRHDIDVILVKVTQCGNLKKHV